TPSTFLADLPFARGRRAERAPDRPWSRKSRAPVASALGAALALVLPGVAAAAPGDPDTGFGTGGRITTDFGGFEQVNGVAVQPDGKIVTAGLGGSGNTSAFAMARHNADGSPDAGFGTDGRVTTGFGATGSAPRWRCRATTRSSQPGRAAPAAQASHWPVSTATAPRTPPSAPAAR
ncbi:delta-60 repeat domain-containing protein, partial [Streptomyces sp. NPDC059233]